MSKKKEIFVIYGDCQYAEKVLLSYGITFKSKEQIGYIITVVLDCWDKALREAKKAGYIKDNFFVSQPSVNESIKKEKARILFCI